MELLTTIVLVISGLILIIGAMVMNTENIGSAIIFKVIPLIIGFTCIIAFFYRLGLFKEVN